MLKLILSITIATLILRESFALLTCDNPQYGKCNCTGNAGVLTKQIVQENCKISTYLLWECNKCKFDAIDYDAFKLYDLNYLHITNSFIRSLGRWTTNINGIVELDLSYNNQTTMSNGVFYKNNKLKSLNLSNNKLLAIQEFFLMNCTNLESFNISHNSLFSFKKGICFTQVPLKELDASYNNLVRIADNSLFSCTKLQKLILSNNKLIKLGKNDLTSEVLLELDLSYNRIRSFTSDDFYNMKNLILLNLSHNQFNFTLNNDEFSKLIKLEQIDLGYNKITGISKNIFANNKKLLKLILIGNSLKTIEPAAFDNLLNLKVLDLSLNQLHELNMYVFVKLINLKELYLNDNQFADLDLVPYVKHNHLLNYATIHNNQFSCANLYANLMELRKLSIQIQPGNSTTGQQYDGINCQKTQEESNISIENVNISKEISSLSLEDMKKLLDGERSTTNNLLIATLFFVVILLIVYTYTNCNLPNNVCKFKRGYNDIELINDN